MPNLFDIVVIGDCSIDTFLGIHEASLHCKLNRKDCQICFQYGGKIPVDNLHFLVGGNAANTAVGFSRLGLKSAIITTIGADEVSDKIKNTLRREGVRTEFIHKETGTSSNFSVSINFQGERTLFTYHVKREHQLPELPTTNWIYLTSLGDYWQKAYEETRRFTRGNNIKLAFGPGSHQLEGEPTLLQEVLTSTTVLFVNKEEAQKIVDEKEENIGKLLVALKKLGPKTVSITDGLNGSWAIAEDGNVFQAGVRPANIVERTGAGDSYAAGFLSALFYELPIPVAMAWGAVNAGSVIEKVGAQTGLLTREEMEKKLKENPKLVAKEYV
ncbi:carbohydrate kinase family protein [Candidatus Microgenomates bacterium]|nr:carbohydrate kinase family protein [Candidatus Microgenomates bacterium]